MGVRRAGQVNDPVRAYAGDHAGHVDRVRHFTDQGFAEVAFVGQLAGPIPHAGHDFIAPFAQVSGQVRP